MKRFLSALFALLALAAATVVFASEKEAAADVRLDITNKVTFAFTTQAGRKISSEDTEDKVRVISFINPNTDTSYFLMDDLSNSQWAGEDTVDILAVDVTGAAQESLALYRDGLDSAAIALVTDKDKRKTAEAFAKEVGLDAKALTLPFTVILDEDGTLQYAMEGYRKPDLLAAYVDGLGCETLPSLAFRPHLFAYNWKDGVKLFWLVDEQAAGYVVWRSDKADGTYEQVYATAEHQEAAYTDAQAKIGSNYFYKLELIPVSGESIWSDSVAVMREIEKP